MIYLFIYLEKLWLIWFDKYEFVVRVYIVVIYFYVVGKDLLEDLGICIKNEIFWRLGKMECCLEKSFLVVLLMVVFLLLINVFLFNLLIVMFR